MQKFSHDLQARGDHTRLRLSGVIDEDNPLTQLTAQIQGPSLILDVGEVDRINSCGVRDWVNWLNSVEAVGTRVVMVRCSPAIISQINMVANFCAEAYIHSFFAPYLNPDTDEERSVLLYTSDLVDQHPIRAPEKLDDDGSALEFDDYEESYFAFIQDMKGKQLPPGAAAHLDRASAQSPRVAPAAPTPTSRPSAPREPVLPSSAPSGDPLASTDMPLHEETGPNRALVAGLACGAVVIIGVILWLVSST